MSCKTTDNMAVTNDLLKVIVPPPQIKPVGITPAVNVNGKIATQTQGRGEGIFSQIVNGAAVLYSTIKQPQGTVGAIPMPGITAGMAYGTGQDKQTTTGGENPNAVAWYETPVLGIPLWYFLGGFAIVKLFKIKF